MKQIVEQWARDHLLDPMSRAAAPAREQIEKALAAVPLEAAKLHAWFEEHFKKAPVAHDTELYSLLYRAKSDLEARFAAAVFTKPAAAAPTAASKT